MTFELFLVGLGITGFLSTALLVIVAMTMDGEED